MHHPPEEQPEFYHDFTLSFIRNMGWSRFNYQHWSTVINCSVICPKYIQDLFQEWFLGSSWIETYWSPPWPFSCWSLPRFRHRISQPGDGGAQGRTFNWISLLKKSTGNHWFPIKYGWKPAVFPQTNPRQSKVLGMFCFMVRGLIPIAMLKLKV